MSFLFLLTGFLSGGSDMLGLPPGPRDAAFVRCAPESAFYYFEWAPRSTGKEGAAGIDGFVADPEVVAFAQSVEKAILASIAAETRGGPEAVFGTAIPQIFKTALNSSGCLYAELDEAMAKKLVENPPAPLPGVPAIVGMLPAYRVTLVLNAGDQSDEFGKHIESLLAFLPAPLRSQGIQRQVLPIPIEGGAFTLHRHESYFILGWGEGTTEAVVKAINADGGGLAENERFQSALQKVAFERTANVSWFDVSGLKEKLIEHSGPQGLMIAQMAKILGLDGVDQYAVATGIVEGRITRRSFLKTDGKTDGVLSLVAGRAITADDFRHVPADSDLVFALSMDFARALESAQQIVGTADPVSKEALDAYMTQLQKELELSFEDDIFPALGQVWTVYDSPSAGGLLFTNPVVAVETADQAKAEKVFSRLMEVLKLALPGETNPGRWSRGVYLTKHDFLGTTIHFVNTVGDDDVPFAPAFCRTETHILFGLHPQALKSHLRMQRSKSGDFSTAMSKRLNAIKGEPYCLCYVQAENAARAFLSFAPYIAQVVFSEIQRDGTPIDVFSWPSAQAFLPYVQDSFSYAVRTPDGLLSESQSILPLPGASSVLMQMPMMLGFAVVRVGGGAGPPVPAAVPVDVEVDEAVEE